MRLIHSFLIYAYNQTPQAVSNSQTAVIKAKKGVDPIIKVGLRWVALAIVLIAGPHSYSSAQTRSIKLFDATPVFDTGPNTSLDRAIPFATRSVVLTFTADDSAILSSTADGTGPLVIDNFISINGVNACFSAMGTIYPGSCFGPFIDFELPINAPIETILTPIPPIDVTALIPVGTASVVFELRDTGTIAGNTDVFLVTTAKPRLPDSVSSTWDGSRMTISSVTSDGRPIALDVTVDGDVLNSTIALAGRQVLQLNAAISSPSPTPRPVFSASFEPTFLGFTAAFKNEPDADVLTGEIAGRQLAPALITQGVELPVVRFVDGQPPPPVSITKEDASALSSFARRVNVEIPTVVPHLAITCKDECIEAACEGAAKAGFHVQVVQTVQGPKCQGTDNAEAAEEYRQQFNECFNRRCSLLGKLGDYGVGYLPHNIGYYLNTVFERVTLSRRR